MNNIKDHESLNQKYVLLRLDLNVPLKNGIIADETRIDKIIPIIEFLIKKGSKLLSYLMLDVLRVKYKNFSH